MEEIFVNEKEAWRIIWGSGEGSRALQRQAREDFSKLYPQGHKMCMREDVGFFERRTTTEGPEESHYERLKNIHPEAFALLRKYGKNYRPWRHVRKAKLEVGPVQPEPRCSSANSYQLMRAVNRDREPGVRKVMYVEGIVLGPFVLPMLHAWNALGLGHAHARDWTFYASTSWTKYFGIPFTQEEYERAMSLCWDKHLRYSLLFDRRWYDKIKNYLEDVLAARPAST